MTMENPQTVPPVDAPYANPYTARTPPPLIPGALNPGSSIATQNVSPGLAFGLGLIPGVGAIYNGQYAKGLMHVVIFGLFITILDSNIGNDVFVALMLAGFCCYMPFEAYHTALRRQRGQTTDEFSSLFPAHSSRFPIAPVVLIALGVIFLLNNLNLLDLGRALRYWPVLLIGLGAYMLFARMSGSGANGRNGAGREGDR